MYNKIDKNLLDKITINSYEINDNFDVLIFSKNNLKLLQILKEKNIGKMYKVFPIISALSMSISRDKILKLQSINEVKFVTADTKVCGLIYQAKKFLNCSVIDSIPKRKFKHTIVVIDTGVYPHIDLVLGKNRIVKFVDLINEKSVPYDDNGHGTFVCGVLGARSVTNKYSGIDDDCNLIVIKALDKRGETTTIKILEAMQWVLDNRMEYNIKVICMSFGSVLKEYDPLIKAVEVLWNSGITVVVAGGNSGPDGMTITSPGASRRVITVGSLKDITKGEVTVADFSSRGPVGSYSKPDLLVPGENIVSLDIYSRSKKFYTKMTGTSVSTPMVAGVISKLIELYPNYSPNKLKYILLHCCDIMTGNTNEEGFGKLNLSNLNRLD